MKRVTLCFILIYCSVESYAQKAANDSIILSTINFVNMDSLKVVIEKSEDDSGKVNSLAIYSFYLAFNQADQSIHYSTEGIKIARKIGFKRGEAVCTESLGWGLWGKGSYTNGLKVGFDALALYEELGDSLRIVQSYFLLANVYRDFGDYNRALSASYKALQIERRNNFLQLLGLAMLGSIYDLQNVHDSASHYIDQAIDLDSKVNSGRWGWLYFLKGNILRKQQHYDEAMTFYRHALTMVQNKDIIETYNGIAILYRETGQPDSTIFYASEAIRKWSHVSYQRGIMQAANILADTYEKINRTDSMIRYLRLGKTLNDSLYSQANERNIQNMAFREEMRREDLIRQKKENSDRQKMYGLLTFGLIFLITALLLWRNNQHRKKANILLNEEKEKVEQTLKELKATQAQLIQSEKMASLGQLTAGIAHEIQNPLNFVNNFSDLNNELLSEMKEEMDKGSIEEAKAIANDVIDNEKKISHHGKKAEAIVKGMLQHARTDTGQQELTDINTFAEEYLRLALHGIRGKDQQDPAMLNVTTSLDLDPAVDKVSIVPQDIGRVLLNLFSNAFYSISEKKKMLGDEFKPVVGLSTSKQNEHIEIGVKDNGIGISKEHLDKIFQPFFTTKPTGQGTGLGLSLSYDIVKAHGGELKVESEEGKGAAFTILLPSEK